MSNGRILPKSIIRNTFTYTLNRWKALNRFTDQGYLSYDNHIAERAVKYPASRLKNYLFECNARAGKHAGNFYSLVYSAKLTGVEPIALLRDLMERLPENRNGEAFNQAKLRQSVPSDELDELLPDQWLVTHPDCKGDIDSIRRKEKRRKEVVKRRKRK